VQDSLRGLWRLDTEAASGGDPDPYLRWIDPTAPRCIEDPVDVSPKCLLEAIKGSLGSGGGLGYKYDKMNGT
jgi:hypothetical protein